MPAAGAGALAEGAALTIAATLATAPLIAFHFETVSTTTLLANLLAMPAVAPAMWLGMASAAASQVPGLPVRPLNAPRARCSSATSPRWPPGAAGRAGPSCRSASAGPDWPFATWGWSPLPSSPCASAASRRLGGEKGAEEDALAARRRRKRGGRGGLGWIAARRRRWSGAAIVLSSFRGAAQPSGAIRAAGRRARRRPGRRDPAQPAGAPAVLVDGGPPGDGLDGKLAPRASTASAPPSSPTNSPITPAASRSCSAASRSPGSSTPAGPRGRWRGPGGRRGPAAGRRRAKSCGREASTSKSSGLRPSCSPSRPRAPRPEPARRVVLLARWRDFAMLLTADAEAEAVPLDPGPVDVLKVAHHGSEDAGLGALLDRIAPSSR